MLILHRIRVHHRNSGEETFEAFISEQLKERRRVVVDANPILLQLSHGHILRTAVFPWSIDRYLSTDRRHLLPDKQASKRRTLALQREETVLYAANLIALLREAGSDGRTAETSSLQLCHLPKTGFLHRPSHLNHAA